MNACYHNARAGTGLPFLVLLMLLGATVLGAQELPEQEPNVLGELTPQNVWYGDTLSMVLQSRDARVTEYRARSVSTINPGQPAPVGSREILPPNVFRYIPARDDHASFSVYLLGLDASGKVHDSDVVQIHPNPTLPPEADALPIAPLAATFPQADDRIYTGVSAVNDIDDARDTTGQWYNALPQDTLVHATIVGKTVVLRKGTGLYDAYFRGRADIRSLAIHADSLVIANTVSVPSAEVTIKARVLTFVDSDDDHPIIDTKPLSWKLTAGYEEKDRKYKKGGRGFDGGDITLDVRTINAPKGFVRFDLRGGDGQNITGGSQDLKGEEAGGGGDGGTLTVRSLIDSAFFEPIVNLAPGQAGRNLATQRRANEGDGSAGSIVHEPREFAWMSAGAMRMAYNHAMDAYIDGFLDYSGEAAVRIVADIDAAQRSSEWLALDVAAQNDLTQLQQEAAARLFQLRNNLDYFGNPPGWTPPLSFAATFALYRDEIEPTMRILFLARWITETMASLQARIAALERTRAEQAALVSRLADEYEATNAKLGPLNTEIEKLDREVIAAQAELAALQEALRQRIEAANKPKEKKWWQKACSIVGAVAQVIPVYQPALGLIGQGLTIAANFDSKNPVASLPAAMNLFKTVKDSNVIERSAQNWEAMVKDLGTTARAIKEQPSDIEKIKAIGGAFKDAKRKYYDPAREAYERAIEAQRAGSATREAVAAQLGQIAAQGSEFAEVTSRIAALMGRKEETARQFGTALTSASAAETGVTNAALAIEAANREAAGPILAFDPRLVAYAKDMEFRARHRLLLYRYYLKKAYEYTFLKPYGRSLTSLQNVATQLDSLMKRENHALTDDVKMQRLKTAYDADLAELKQEIIEGIVKQVTPREQKQSMEYVFTRDQLDSINRGETVTINFAQSDGVPLANERLRLANLTFKGLHASRIPSRAAKIEIVHSGLSTMTSEGKRFVFRHYGNGETEYPTKWMATIQSNGSWSNDSPANTTESILAALLDRNEGAMTFFAGMGMDANVLVRLEANSRGSIELDTLSVRVDYVYAQAPEGAGRPQTLRVRTNNPMFTPYYALNRAGRNAHTPSYRTGVETVARKDGRGELWRSYDEGDTVTVLAPMTYGASRFIEWRDRNWQRLPSNGPQLKVAMDRYQDVTAVYGPAPSVDVPLEAVAGEPFEGIVEVVPNPATDAARARIVVARTGAVRVSIVDAGGHELVVLLDEDLEAGSMELPLRNSGLASGTYFLRMTTGRTSSVRTFTISR